MTYLWWEYITDINFFGWRNSAIWGGSWAVWGESFPLPPPLDRTLFALWIYTVLVVKYIWFLLQQANIGHIYMVRARAMWKRLVHLYLKLPAKLQWTVVTVPTSEGKSDNSEILYFPSVKLHAPQKLSVDIILYTLCPLVTIIILYYMQIVQSQVVARESLRGRSKVIIV